MSTSRLRLRITRVISILVIATFALGTDYWTNAHPVVEKSLFLIGISLAAFGAIGRLWAITFISGHKSSALVTAGPYSLCRNPLYFFSLLLGIGLAFCTETFTVPAIVGGAMLLMTFLQIRQEEGTLSSLFGSDYQNYLQTVPRLVPSFRCYSEPESTCISPRLLKNGLFGVAYLLILIGVFEFLEGLHTSGVLPTFFRIY